MIDVIRFKQTLPTGGIPMYIGDWLSMQEQMLLASLTLYRSLGSEMILSGMIPTLSAGAYPSVTISTISEGYVLLNGDMYKFDLPTGTIGTATAWVVPDNSILPISRTLKSGSSVPVMDVKKAKVVTSQPSSGPYISFAPFASAVSSAGVTKPAYLNDQIALNSRKLGEIITYGGALNGSSNVPFFDSTGLGLFSFRGFALCNGNNATKDLRGRFIAGMDPADPDYQSIAINSNIAYKGGEKRHLLSAAESGLPAHIHTATVHDPGHSHSHSDRYADSGGVASGDSRTRPVNDTTVTRNTSSNGTGITVTVNANNAINATIAHENRPPFYTLAFIQRIF